MPKKSIIDISEIGKNLVRKSQEIAETVPSARPEAPSEEQGRVGAGRPKRYTISRKNAKTVYFDDDMFKKLDEVKYNSRVNMQRVIQTALYDFLRKYYVDGKLTDKGLEHIENYERSVSI